MRSTLNDVLNKSFHSNMHNIYTVLPGKIETYDAIKKKASVKPMIKKNVRNDIISYPIITDVPVIFPSSRDSAIIFSISKGDGCLLLFSCESMENFLSSTLSNDVEPGDNRKFSLTDAICLPGLYTFSNPGKTSTVIGTEIIYKNYKITIDSTGITLNSNDASFWKPNILPVDPFTGLPHGGVNAGIVKLRGA